MMDEPFIKARVLCKEAWVVTEGYGSFWMGRVRWTLPGSLVCPKCLRHCKDPFRLDLTVGKPRFVAQKCRAAFLGAR